MTRERAKELLPVIQAFAEGKDVQMLSGGEWSDIICPAWASHGAYRIKPEPRRITLYKMLDGSWHEFHNGCVFNEQIEVVEVVK